MHIYIDKDKYKNEDSTKNECFYNDWNELSIVSNDRFREVQDFDISVYVENKYSIIDVIAQRQTQIQIKQNPFPQIFTGTNNKAFTLFETFTKKHLLDKYIDFSYIFQQMKFNGYISDIKHLKFMDWLNENKYINEKEYSDFKIEKSFRSLKKCAFGTRVDLYLKLHESIIKSDSDLSE